MFWPSPEVQPTGPRLARGVLPFWMLVGAAQTGREFRGIADRGHFCDIWAFIAQFFQGVECP